MINKLLNTMFCTDRSDIQNTRKTPVGTMRFCFDSNEYEMFDGENWVKMITPTLDTPKGQVLRVSEGEWSWGNIPSNESKTTNCPNCGAPLHNGKCEYCGTEVW